MNLFPSRTDSGYISELRDRLSLEGEKGLLATAVPFSAEEEKGGHQISRGIHIDFVGIAARTLFDVSTTAGQRSMFSYLQDLVCRADDLNKNGVAIRVRMLLLYPYSSAAYARMQAEWTENRASIREPRYTRKFDFIDQIDERMFRQSTLTRHQTHTLQRFQELLDTSRQTPGWQPGGANRLRLRFTPVNPMMCMLLINNVAFQDTYLFAKEDRRGELCAKFYAPLVQVDGEDGDGFRALQDHFRYLWELDLSIDMDDATRYVPDEPRSLSHVRPPYEITFESKSARIRDIDRTLTTEQADSWKGCVTRVLHRFCTDLQPTPGSESLFITCSWSEVAGKQCPNRIARDLAVQLGEDLSRPPGGVAVRIMQAETGKFLSRALYSALEETTAGLVLLTKDLQLADGRFVGKPNVYHELGYLMKKLGPERVLIVAENGVEIPSNVGDIVRVSFQADKVVLKYPDIIGFLRRTMLISPAVVSRVRENLTRRLKDFERQGKISASEMNTCESGIV